MGSDRIESIIYTTKNINLASVMLCAGAHLQGVSADAARRPPECTFSILWSGSYWKSLDDVAEHVLDEVLELLGRASSELDAEGERQRSADVHALRETLAAGDGDLQESVDAFENLWRSRKLRVEPQAFDKQRRRITDGMRDAQTEALRGNVHGTSE